AADQDREREQGPADTEPARRNPRRPADDDGRGGLARPAAGASERAAVAPAAGPARRPEAAGAAAARRAAGGRPGAGPVHAGAGPVAPDYRADDDRPTGGADHLDDG